MVWLDHSSVQIMLGDLWTKPQPLSWHLNAFLLNDPITFKEIETSQKQYFQEYSSSTTSPNITWAAHKVTIWGKLIQIASSVKWSLEQTIGQQDKELQQVLREQHLNQHLDHRPQIDAARTALYLSLTTKARKYIRWYIHQYYTMGDKPNILLVRKLTPLMPFTPAIQKLCLRNGQLQSGNLKPSGI